MIKLITFTNDNEKLLEFNFKNCDIEYFQPGKWITATSAKQKLTIKGNSFIAYDDEIFGVVADSTYFTLSKKWIELFYKDNDKILIVSSIKDEPLYIFRGKAISVATAGDDFLHFKIDEKDLYLNNLHWIILTRNS